MNRRSFFKTGVAAAAVIGFANNSWALKYYPAKSTKTCAVLYSTWCGSSRDASLWISEGMGGIADVFDVRESPDLKGFDHIIVGGSIRSMVTSKELQDYLTKNSDWLKPKIRGLFAVCGNMRKPVEAQQTTALIDNHLAKLCQAAKVPSRVFLGRVTKSLMDPDTAKGMASMEDYDNLKRSECMAFGREVVAAIG